jgi:uncharacterized protein (DUF302 family)
MRRFPLLIAALALATTALSTQAMAEIITKQSPHPVKMTIDRLQAAVEGAGATVFARVDHAAGATSVDLELRPTELLIFGNPKMGALAMRDAQISGLDLPLRVLAYEDADGVVHVSYNTPTDLVADHGVPADAPYLEMMAGALDKLTSKAIAVE